MGGVYDSRGERVKRKQSPVSPQNENVLLCKVEMSGFMQGGREHGTGRIELSTTELERLNVLHELVQGHLKQIEAERRLRLTDRHVRRLQQRLRVQGDRGILHGLRGQRSNRKILDTLLCFVPRLYIILKYNYVYITRL